MYHLDPRRKIAMPDGFVVGCVKLKEAAKDLGISASRVRCMSLRADFPKPQYVRWNGSAKHKYYVSHTITQYLKSHFNIDQVKDS